jgi:hypothetical protein
VIDPLKPDYEAVTGIKVRTALSDYSSDEVQ